MIPKACLKWLASLLTLATILLILILTPLGLKLCALTAEMILPGQLNIDGLKGQLSGPIDITSLSYRDQDQSMRVESLHLAWQPLDLFRKKITVTELTARRFVLLDSHSKKTQTKSSNNQPSIPTFLTILHANIRHLQINEYRLNSLTINTSTPPKTPDESAFLLSAKLTTPVRMHLQLHANGTYDNFMAQLQLKNDNTQWILSGHTKNNKLQLNTQNARFLGGHLALSGELNWKKSLHWQGKLTGKGIQTATLNAQLPKALNLHLKTTGEMTDKQLNTLSCDLTVSSLNSAAALQLDYHHHWHASWNINIPDLSIIPDSQGSITTKGSWTGDIDHPLSQGSLSLLNVKWNAYQAMAIHANWQFLKLKQQSNASLIATQLDFGPYKIRALALQLQGSLQHPNITMNSDINRIHIVSRLSLDNTDNKTLLSLSKLSLSSPTLDDLELIQPSNLSFSNNQLLVPNLCFKETHQKGTFCMNGSWHAIEKWRLNIEGKTINPSIISHLVLPSLTFKSTINLHATISGKGKRIKRTHSKLTLSQGHIIYQMIAKKIEVAFQKMVLNVSMTPKKLETKAKLFISKGNTLHMTVRMTDPSNALKKDSLSSLSGNIQLHIDKLGIITQCFPSISDPSGQLVANLSLSGTTNTPTMKGDIELNHGRFTLSPLGITLDKAHANLVAKNNQLDFTLITYSKKSPITLKGMSSWQGHKISLSAQLTAKDALLMDTPEYQLYASPNIKLRFQDNTLSLDGNIKVPKGRLKPKHIASVTTLPANEVEYIGQSATSADEPINIHSNVIIEIGDDVAVQAKGLDANINGSALITSTPDNATLIDGRINVVKGEYEAYGKKLTINSGSYLQFIKSPIGNPSLNIRATKTIPVNSAITGQQTDINDIVVGVDIRGTTHQPKITLFSIPNNLTQSDILSYLLLGYAATSANGAKTSNMDVLIQAANSLQFGGAGRGGQGGIVNEIKHGLGLTELGVETEIMVDAIGTPIDKKTSFVVGKMITSRLYFNYKHGLGSGPLTEQNTFTLKYLLSKNWSIQAISSNLGNGGDVLYTMELK